VVMGENAADVLPEDLWQMLKDLDMEKGVYNKKLVSVMEKSGFPQEIHLEIGKRLRVRTQDGKYTMVTIKDFTEDSIVLDENDPLAGKTLTFKIEFVDII